MEHKSFPVKIDNPHDVVIYDLITIIRNFGEKVDVAHFVRDDLTLDNIETKGANYITVIAESPLHGEVYRYGSHGKYWEQVGTVCGYA
ncbi:MAG: hypothetical protein HDT42_09060 [Ruminococcaceae bacterium]|nr:hypothetical protein [Oscillospiraceae bacterium]